MNRMTRIKIWIFVAGLIMFSLTNPVLMIPGLAIAVLIISKQAKMHREAKERAARRVQDRQIAMFR